MDATPQPPRLICIAGEAIPPQIDIDDQLELGRDPHCDVRLLGESASRYHLRLQPLAEGGFRVYDYGSRNGTLIDGQLVTAEQVFQPGQRLEAGGATFVVIDHGNEQATGTVVADGGMSLRSLAATPPRPWQGGDDPAALPGLHTLTRQLARRHDLRARARLLGNLCWRLTKSQHWAIIRRGSLLAGTCSLRLAQRLAGGRQARLLALGKDLQGQTIAAEAVGSAATAPLSNDCWLVVTRGLEQEALNEQDLLTLARLAGEASPYIPGIDAHHDPFAPLVGTSRAMQDLRRRLRRLAGVDATVLITGPSGSGKELVATCLHQASGRSDAPLVAVNCAAVASSLFEAELFGHEKGAFTGADSARPGRIRMADGGTLFLDEIGELPLPMQAKLLRVLQEGQVEPVGAGKPVSVNVRVLAATNRDLGKMVQKGDFREDLFYRLDVLRVLSPALDQRREDIPLLAKHLLAHLATQHGRTPPLLPESVAEFLQAQAWPGNVRQLANALERALVFSETAIAIADLDLPETAFATTAVDPDHFPTLAQMEARHVAAALSKCQGNKSAAARLLAVSRPTLLRKLSDYGIDHR